jgi:prevent-host-death family protein
MKHLPASVFKAQCLRVMDDVHASGEPVLVTKRGMPSVMLVPIESQKTELFGFMAGEFKIVADIELPISRSLSARPSQPSCKQRYL